MKKKLVLFFLLLYPVATFAGPLDDEKLLQHSDISYLGGFRLPEGSFAGGDYSTFSYSISSLAYNPNGGGGLGSLFVSGHNYYAKVAEVTIPELVSNPADYYDYNIASVVDGTFYDITQGDIYNSRLDADGSGIANGSKMGGLYLYGDELIGTAYAYYDGGYAAVKNFFNHSIVLSDSSSYSGMLTVDADGKNVGFNGGYIAKIPQSWQSALGGKLFSGLSGLAITGRTSQGPAAFVFNPDFLEAGRDHTNPVPSDGLLYYEDATGMTTLGNWTGTYEGLGMWSASSRVSGAVFPAGTRSILFWGEYGEGPFCYKTNPDGCIDPARPDTVWDVHNYPYYFKIWAYDAHDLLNVRNGNQEPWEIVPYGFWTITLPNTKDDTRLYAATWDESREILYVAARSDRDTDFPIIHAFSIDAGVPMISILSSPGIVKSTIPEIIFTSDKTGDINYEGSCLSATTSAITGENRITLNSLNIGSYSDCTLTVTDNEGNSSTPLQIPEFTITYPSDNDLDKDVDIFDYNILLSEFGVTSDCANAADTNEDCQIDIFDYNNLLGDFGKSII